MRHNFEIRIREFQKLKKGWHFGEGNTFSQEHVEVAAQIAVRYYNKYNLRVSGTPCIDGSIDLSFNKNDTFLDVKIFPVIGDTHIKYSKGIDSNRIDEDWGDALISQLDVILERFNNLND